MKRIVLLVLTNLLVVVVLGIVASVLGVNQFLTGSGLNLGLLLGYALVIGFGGAFISLLISKPLAKWSSGVRLIEQPQNADEAWIVQTVQRLAQLAGIGMPEVGVFDGEPNAFATGAFRDSALVAVSTGLLQGMTRDEVEAVLAHEVAHIANGDMVTMTLLQGVVNTFVVFFSRIIGYMAEKAMNKDSNGDGMISFAVSMVFQILFGVLASMIVAWFSRHREFRADAGAAALMGHPQAMISALGRLHQMQTGALPQNMAAMGIGPSPGLMQLFSTHPPLEERIAALQAGSR
jgi:heat shock protein HtpX